MKFRGMIFVAMWCGMTCLQGCGSMAMKADPNEPAMVDMNGGRSDFTSTPGTGVAGSLGAAGKGLNPQEDVDRAAGERGSQEMQAFVLRQKDAEHESSGQQAERDSTPEKLSVDPSSTQPAEQANRVIIYSGLVRLVVPDIASGIESIRLMAVGMGGYLQEMDNKSIKVRVPAKKFDLALQQVLGKGEVVDKEIKAADVTEEMRDLDIRLANAEQTRKQLLDLLGKSGKMEDTIKIEAELERVTGEVELYKGKIRFMQLDVAYSVLKVELNSRVPQTEIVAAIPFPWVRELGQGASSGGSPSNAEAGGWFSGAVGFDLPVGYIRYFQEEDHTEAMSADGVLIKAQRHENFKGGDITFWSKLAKRSLLKNGAVAIISDADAKADGEPGRLIEGTKDVSGSGQKYLLMIAVNGDRVYTFEAWGPKDAMEKDGAELEKAAGSMEVK